MNKKWTEQKYIVHFILSVLVMTLSSGAALGLRACRGESGRAEDAGIASGGELRAEGALPEGRYDLFTQPDPDRSALEKRIPYMASGQRVSAVKTMFLTQEEEISECSALCELSEYESFSSQEPADDPENVREAGAAALPGEAVLNGGAGESLSAEDYEALLRIVQAEAGNEDIKGRILVANVVLNRVADERFPMSVYEVVFQKSGGRAQFSPISSGSYYKVVVTPETKEAVDRALAGEDYSEGALYFVARRYAGKKQLRWFDECLEKLFVYGGHEFFKG